MNSLKCNDHRVDGDVYLIYTLRLIINISYWPYDGPGSIDDSRWLKEV